MNYRKLTTELIVHELSKLGIPGIPMYDLYIANKNYSSWSLRPWVLMRELGIEFTEHLIPFGHVPSWDAYRKISPSGKVPCLVDAGRVVWDSLSIAEYLAERHEAGHAAQYRSAD